MASCAVMPASLFFATRCLNSLSLMLGFRSFHIDFIDGYVLPLYVCVVIFVAVNR